MPRTVQLASKPSVGEGLVPDDHVVVLFGGTGDLARRKLLPQHYRIIATSRGDVTDERFREFAKTAVEEFGSVTSTAAWRRFAANLSFASLETLPAAVAHAESELGTGTRRLFYLSVPPATFAGIVSML